MRWCSRGRALGDCSGCLLGVSGSAAVVLPVVSVAEHAGKQQREPGEGAEQRRARAAVSAA